MLLPLLIAFFAPGAPPPQTVFTCSAGHKEIAITQEGDRLTYSFGPRGRPEISLHGGPDGGVFYHRELYARGEDQTLRFVQDEWSYIVFNRWQAPDAHPEHNVSGLLVMKDGKLVRRINCAKDSGDLREWAIFKRLRQDDENLTPDDA